MIFSRNALAVMLGGGAGAVCRVMTGFAVMEKLPSGFPLGVLEKTSQAGTSMPNQA